MVQQGKGVHYEHREEALLDRDGYRDCRLRHLRSGRARHSLLDQVSIMKLTEAELERFWGKVDKAPGQGPE